MPSFYVPDLNEKDKETSIVNDEFHHLINVFRHKVNDIITLNNGKGLLCTAQILSIAKKVSRVRILERKAFLLQNPQISVYFSFLKSKNDHLLVEKLTELGVRNFFPLIFARSVKITNSVSKLEKVAISAIKQCDNCWKPVVNQPRPFRKLIEDYRQETNNILIAAVERGASLLVNQCLPGDLPDNIGIIIGPEGGFTDEELQDIDDTRIRKVTLGNHIVRAETAAICAVSQLLLVINNKMPGYY